MGKGSIGLNLLDATLQALSRSVRCYEERTYAKLTETNPFAFGFRGVIRRRGLTLQGKLGQRSFFQQIAKAEIQNKVQRGGLDKAPLI